MLGFHRKFLRMTQMWHLISIGHGSTLDQPAWDTHGWTTRSCKRDDQNWIHRRIASGHMVTFGPHTTKTKKEKARYQTTSPKITQMQEPQREALEGPWISPRNSVRHLVTSLVLALWIWSHSIPQHWVLCTSSGSALGPHLRPQSTWHLARAGWTRLSSKGLRTRLPLFIQFCESTLSFLSIPFLDNVEHFQRLQNLSNAMLCSVRRSPHPQLRQVELSVFGVNDWKAELKRGQKETNSVCTPKIIGWSAVCWGWLAHCLVEISSKYNVEPKQPARFCTPRKIKDWRTEVCWASRYS